MEREANTCGVNIRSFRAHNGVFKSKEFKLELEDYGQAVTLCGVGAHHQNGIAERYLRTMVERTRTVLLNAHDGLARDSRHRTVDLCFQTHCYKMEQHTKT